MSARSKAIVNETGNSPVELSRVPTAITGQPPLVTSSIDPSGGKRSEHVPSRDTDPCALQSNTICPVISAGSTGVGVGVGAWNGLQASRSQPHCYHCYGQPDPPAAREPSTHLDITAPPPPQPILNPVQTATTEPLSTANQFWQAFPPPLPPPKPPPHAASPPHPAGSCRHTPPRNPSGLIFPRARAGVRGRLRRFLTKLPNSLREIGVGREGRQKIGLQYCILDSISVRRRNMQSGDNPESVNLHLNIFAGISFG